MDPFFHITLGRQKIVSHGNPLEHVFFSRLRPIRIDKEKRKECKKEQQYYYYYYLWTYRMEQIEVFGCVVWGIGCRRYQTKTHWKEHSVRMIASTFRASCTMVAILWSLIPIVANSLPDGFVKEFVANRSAVTGRWVSQEIYQTMLCFLFADCILNADSTIIFCDF